MCRSGSLTTVARELARYKLDLAGVQEVRWDKRGRVRAGDCIFSVEKNIKCRIISAVKRIKFVSDRMSL
jgi:hypothetical protein